MMHHRVKLVVVSLVEIQLVEEQYGIVQVRTL